MDTDIRDLIDRSFGDGPAQPSVEEPLAAGRRALRRRRGLVATAAGAVLVVLGGSYAVASSGPPSDPGTPVAADPTTSSPTSSPTSVPPEPAWEGDLPIRYLDGELQIRPGVVVHRHLENPYDYAPPRRSDAFDLTWRGHRTWLLAEHTERGLGYTSTSPSNGWASFEDWVADQVGSTVAGDDGWPETVRLDAAGAVVAASGARIVQRTDDPRLGDSFAPAGAKTGAAVVAVDGDDRSYFVVWRVIDGELDVITTPPRDVVGATFEQLLSSARARYASGEGLR